MTDEHRTKIKNSKILNALIEIAEGQREGTPTQVAAAVALLKKVLPDVSHVQLTGDEENPVNVVHRVELVGRKAG